MCRVLRSPKPARFDFRANAVVSAEDAVQRVLLAIRRVATPFFLRVVHLAETGSGEEPGNVTIQKLPHFGNAQLAGDKSVFVKTLPKPMKEPPARALTSSILDGKRLGERRHKLVGRTMTLTKESRTPATDAAMASRRFQISSQVSSNASRISEALAARSLRARPGGRFLAIPVRPSVSSIRIPSEYGSRSCSNRPLVG